MRGSRRIRATRTAPARRPSRASCRAASPRSRACARARSQPRRAPFRGPFRARTAARTAASSRRCRGRTDARRHIRPSRRRAERRTRSGAPRPPRRIPGRRGRPRARPRTRGTTSGRARRRRLPQCAKRFDVAPVRLPRSRLHVVTHLLPLRRARDHRHDRRHREQAADGDVEHRDVALLRVALHRLDLRPAFGRYLASGEPPFLRRLPQRMLPGQQPAREREIRQHADPEAVAGPEHVVLCVALDEAVLVLRRDEARPSTVARNRVRLLDLRRGEVRGAGPTHLALAHELVECAQRLLDRRRRIGLVHLVDVDHIGAQSPQRSLDRPADVLARAARLGRVRIHRLAELRREEEGVASPLERTSDELLARALRVDVRRVEERYPLLDRLFQHGLRLLVIDSRAEVVRAEPDDRDLGAFRAERTRLHAGLLAMNPRARMRMTTSPRWLTSSCSPTIVPRPGSRSLAHASTTRLRPVSTSPGRTGTSQRSSSTPGEPMLALSSTTLRTNMPMYSEAVCHPLAMSPPNGPSTSGSTWNG